MACLVTIPVNRNKTLELFGESIENESFLKNVLLFCIADQFARQYNTSNHFIAIPCGQNNSVENRPYYMELKLFNKLPEKLITISSRPKLKPTIKCVLLNLLFNYLLLQRWKYLSKYVTQTKLIKVVLNIIYVSPFLSLIKFKLYINLIGLLFLKFLTTYHMFTHVNV